MPRFLAPIIALFSIGLSPGDQPAKSEPVLSGPFKHDNLTVFLVHGSDVLTTKKNLLTLDEALEAKKLVVHETGQVNQLQVENLSNDEVFIQAGDIVRGGRQDRVLSMDMIVPAHSKKIPVDSFCVESGRWTKRGGEEAGRFSASKHSLASKSLKMAARDEANQSQVWEKVGEVQGKLTENVGKKVSSAESESSLELTLENGDIEKVSAAYLKDLSGVIEGKKDAIGFAFAINGKMNSAEVYGSNALFTKLWPKLVKAAVVEAISEKNTSKGESVTTADAKKFFAEQAALTQAEVRKVQGAVNAKAKKGGRVTFETRDPDKADRVFHKSLY